MLRVLNYALLRSCECNDAKEPHFYIHFFLSLGEEGGSTYEASPLPLPSPLQPHCTLEVAALRAGLDLALTRYTSF